MRVPAKLPRASWAFVILAVVTGLVLALDHSLPLWPDTEADVGPYIRHVFDLILSVIPPVAAILFGAALFARHRRAWTTHRLLVVGPGHACDRRGPPGDHLQPRRPVPGRDSADGRPVHGASERDRCTACWRRSSSTLGIVYVARGLRFARQRPDPQTGRYRDTAIAAVAALLAASVAVGGLITIARASSADPADVYLAYNATDPVHQLADARRAGVPGGHPVGGHGGRRGAGRGMAPWHGRGVVDPPRIRECLDRERCPVMSSLRPETDFTLWTWISLVWSMVVVIGYVLLLAAFTRGLPSGPDEDRPATVG